MLGVAVVAVRGVFMGKESLITAVELRELLHYQPETGVFTRLVAHGRYKVGDVAGSLHHTGYIRVKVLDREYKAHRLAWLYVTGAWPAVEVDHDNRIRADNRWTNLRLATRLENSRNRPKHKNNKSGFKGVCWVPRSSRWRAQCRIMGKRHHLGNYVEKQDAIDAYQAFAKLHHGEFYSDRAISDGGQGVVGTLQPPSHVGSSTRGNFLLGGFPKHVNRAMALNPLNRLQGVN